MATERLQQRDASLMLHPQVQPDVVEVRAVISALAAGDVTDVGVRLLPTKVAAIDVNAGAIEMDNGRGQPQTSDRRGGNETIECGHPILIQCIPGAPESISLEVVGVDLWRQEPVRGIGVQKHRDPVAWVVHKASSLEDHGLDGVPHRHHPALGGLLLGVVDAVAKAELVA
jgi:hypothetical protein